MVKDIVLSQQSLDFINAYLKKYPSQLSLPTSVNAINDWLYSLSQESSPAEVSELRYLLMNDLLKAMNWKLPKSATAKQYNNKFRYVFISLSGLMIAACEGFDNIVTFMTMFSISPVVVLACGIGFSLLSIALFCTFDLYKLSVRCNVSLINASKLLDISMKEFDAIQSLRKSLIKENWHKLTVDELQQRIELNALLLHLVENSQKTSQQFSQILHSRRLNIAKKIFTSASTFFYFGGGFCAAQTVAMFALGFFMTSVSPVSLPVIVFSVIIGLLAVGFKWYVETPALRSVVSSWFGLQEEKIHYFCNEDLFNKEKVYLHSLQEHLLEVERTNKKSDLKNSTCNQQSIAGNSIFSSSRSYSNSPAIVNSTPSTNSLQPINTSLNFI